MKILRLEALMAVLMTALLSACNTTEEPKQKSLPKEGDWVGYIMLSDTMDMPFNFELKHSTDSTFTVEIQNADERILVKDILQEDDSARLNMPVFGNYIKTVFTENVMTGTYHNPDAENYHLPFKATFGKKSRFTVLEKNCCDINEKWRVRFSPGTPDSSDAIAYFDQVNDTLVQATFVTETGDYRYLQGVLSGESLKLSTFDGAHLFYFDANITSGQEIYGIFYSGRTFSEPWRAYRDDDFQLRNPDSLTFIKDGYEGFEFSFPTVNGETVSLADKRFENKAVIVQISGSWCPNCMDETRFFSDLYEAYNARGLEIVGLSFERARTKKNAIQRVKKMTADLKVPYPFLMAGYTRDDKAAEVLPMLNHVMSYPTAIFLNRNHEVVKIHTGFSGPGTPVYDAYTLETKQFVEDLVIEK